MTSDDIIRMAREVGIDAESDTLCRHGGWVEPIKRFAALVAAAEREACARLCDKTEELAWDTWDRYADTLDQGSAVTAAHLAATIRARGKS